MSSQTSRKQETPTIIPYRTMQGHTAQVQGVVHLPDGRRNITCSVDGSLRLWDLEGSAQIGEDWRDEGDKEAGLRKMALSPNSKTLASGSDDGKVKLWNVETGKVIAKWTGHTERVLSVCWSVDGNRVGSGSWDGTARVWNVKNGETILEIKTGHKHVWTMIYSPDSPNQTKIATGGYKEFGVKIWDAKTGELITTLKHNRIVFSLAWTSDGKKLISGSYGPIGIFDTATWDQLAILNGHQSYVRAFSLSRNNLEPPLQHKDKVYSAAFSANEQVLVTGCSDNNVCAWDIHPTLKKAGLEDLQHSSEVSARKSLKDSGATRRPPIQARRIPPDFFNGVQNDTQFSTARATDPHSPAHRPRRALALSFANLHGLLERLSSFFHHSRSNDDAATELRQRPSRSISSRGPCIVEVATVQDRKPLAVAAPRQVQHTNTTGATAAGATPAQSPPFSWWTHVVLFLCCTSPRQATQIQQQQQSQAHGQVQVQAQPAAASMSTTPAPPTSTTPPNPATAQSRPLPLRARFDVEYDFTFASSSLYSDIFLYIFHSSIGITSSP
ncbi:WD40-repeat-containing domain protein [Suillus americanus]|nr:WD40-repeat-containing domain protein [Suillus americanus]